MNAAEWDAGAIPSRMLCAYPAAWDRRKVWLFWCAAMRRVWYEASERTLVALVENDPDGTNPRLRAEVDAVRHLLVSVGNPIAHPGYWRLGVFLDAPPGPLVALLARAAALTADGVTRRAGFDPMTGRWYQHRNDVEVETGGRQCDLIREVFGNPFRPVGFAPWRTDTVLALARDLYDHREYSGMPILADALQDAGCEDEYVLNHCRGEGEHVRGCWVLDGLLRP